MLRTLFSGPLAAALLFIAPASATVIDFNAQPLGNNPNPLVLPGATFNTPGGFNYITNAFLSNGLCPSVASDSPANCSRDLEVLFDAPSSGISFTFSGNNDITIGDVIGGLQMYSGATLLGITNVVVTDANSTSHDLVSLGSVTGVTRIVIESTDPGGVVYDDFTFTTSDSGVPEPATWTMAAAGFVLVGAGLRRRRLHRYGQMAYHK